MTIMRYLISIITEYDFDQAIEKTAVGMAGIILNDYYQNCC